MGRALWGCLTVRAIGCPIPSETHPRWTPSHHRSPAKDPAFHPGEFDRIYAIYTLIEPLGAVWS